MSVAIDYDYADDYAAEHYRPCDAPVGATRLAGVTTLHAPTARTIAPPLRLTRRGVQVVAAAVAVVAISLVAFARVSAPSAASHATVPDTVTVRAGDTLWSIASRLAPQADPQAEVADLQRLNHLGGVALVPGQVLRTH